MGRRLCGGRRDRGPDPPRRVRRAHHGEPSPRRTGIRRPDRAHGACAAADRLVEARMCVPARGRAGLPGASRLCLDAEPPAPARATWSASTCSGPPASSPDTLARRLRWCRTSPPNCSRDRCAMHCRSAPGPAPCSSSDDSTTRRTVTSSTVPPAGPRRSRPGDELRLAFTLLADPAALAGSHGDVVRFIWRRWGEQILATGSEPRAPAADVRRIRAGGVREHPRAVRPLARVHDRRATGRWHVRTHRAARPRRGIGAAAARPHRGDRPQLPPHPDDEPP